MAAVIFTGHSESILQGLIALLALKYVEIHLKHSNRTYKKVTSFLVMSLHCSIEWYCALIIRYSI